eukprot:TRINITY_DN68143_c6_g2_i2.p1 TRINITY_DN68143_c6_g2~~TRINITY_DN68143_c6_g2_i2.p1  ORF type:complete len:125 (+),score=4.52 TRINITY_DN68143_c6_g2_i2:165-539(+)
MQHSTISLDTPKSHKPGGAVGVHPQSNSMLPSPPGSSDLISLHHMSRHPCTSAVYSLSKSPNTARQSTNAQVDYLLEWRRSAESTLGLIQQQQDGLRTDLTSVPVIDPGSQRQGSGKAQQEAPR